MLNFPLLPNFNCFTEQQWKFSFGYTGEFTLIGTCRGKANRGISAGVQFEALSNKIARKSAAKYLNRASFLGAG